MDGQHYSPRNASARRRAHPLLTVNGSLRAGTRTAGPARLAVPSRRFCVTSRCVGGWEMEPWTVTPDRGWRGLAYGGGGCSRSVGRSSTSTSTRAARSVARSVRLSDSVLNATQSGDDPADGTEEPPRGVSSGEAGEEAARHDGDDAGEESVVSHSAECNRSACEAVRDG